MAGRTCFALTALLLLASPAYPDGRPIVAAGDSICEGVAAAAHLPNYAQRGARTALAAINLNRVPSGSIVYFCAGTNDGPAQLLQFEMAVDSALTAARARDLLLVWIGPVRTRLWWDRFSDQADTMLAVRLAVAGVKYVSLRAVRFRTDELSGDGIHFTPRGYRRIAALAGGR